MKSKRAEPRATYPALADETRAIIDTNTAAYHLNRKPQTLRIWSCRQNGPIKPRVINGRLGWSTAELREIVGISNGDARGQ
jgi:hypothetical protein